MEILEKIKELLGNKIIDSGVEKEQRWVNISHDDIVSALLALKGKFSPPFDFLTDLCGVDNYPGNPRFQVVYHLFSTDTKDSVRIKVDVPEDTLTIPSSISVWSAANWLEREAYDMYGIRFSGRPDLRRILMHEDFLEYPQRKDFPLRGSREEAD